MTVVINGTTGISPVSAAGTSASIDGMTVGRGAGEVATNTAVGASALAANTSGVANTSVGNNAMAANTTGNNNHAFGQGALQANTTGGQNVAIGRLALAANNADSNTAVGHNALTANTSGASNVALGYASLVNNTTGNNNTAVGKDAAQAVTTGSAVVAMGRATLYSNTTGSYNTALGETALYSNTTASYNTAVGYQAGYNTTGANNTFVGNQTGYPCTTGSQNTCLGDEAGYGAVNLTTGTNNVLIGFGVAGGAGNASYEIVIGGQSSIRGKGTGTGFIAPGSTATTGGGAVYQGNNSASWATTSDQRIKQNFVPVTNGLEVINALDPFEFDYIVTGKHDVGFKAQQYMTVLPDQVSKHAASPEEEALAGEAEIYGIQRNLDPYLVSAIKTLTTQITALQAEIAALKGQA